MGKSMETKKINGCLGLMGVTTFEGDGSILKLQWLFGTTYKNTPSKLSFTLMHTIKFSFISTWLFLKRQLKYFKGSGSQNLAYIFWQLRLIFLVQWKLSFFFSDLSVWSLLSMLSIIQAYVFILLGDVLPKLFQVYRSKELTSLLHVQYYEK